MRFGIDFRMLAAGRAVVHRGMGRFTQQQLREVLRLPAAAAHDFVLLLPPSPAGEGLLPEIAAAANVSQVILPPALAAATEPGAARDVLRQAAALSALAADLKLDLLHATTPFLAAEPGFWRCDSCALVATHYDLIPLLYPERYYHGAEREIYLRTAAALPWADRLLAISHHVAGEAALQLGIDRRRIDVAHPIAEPWFRPLAPGVTAAALAALGRRLGTPLAADGFLLTVTHLHHAKNLPTLLRAFAAMPAAWRRRHPLVVAGDFDDECLATLSAWRADLGILGDIVVPGFLAEDELAALYNGCHLFVLPSRYEGFGLPALEAMRCGAAVVATCGGALPEVVGDAGELVDAESPESFTAAFQRLTADPGRRRELGAAALARAAAWSGRQLGEATLACYLQAVSDDAAARPPRPGRLRLALWGPLPPLASGISDYTAELLPELGREADLELFVDDGYLPARDLLAAWPVFHYTAFARRRARRPYDAVIYQLGASMFHVFMLEAIERWPGILVLHDLTLGYVHLDLYAGGWPLAEVDRDLVRNEGTAARNEHAALATAAAAVNAASDAGNATDTAASLAHAGEDFLGRHYMLRALVAASRAEIVHLPRAREELAARYPSAHVFTFPMGVEDPRVSDPGADRAQLRRLYGLPPDAFLIGAFGIADPVKRLDSAVRAVARVAAEVPGALLIVVGRFSRPAYRVHLNELARQLGIGARLRIFEQVAKGDFYRLLLACDAVVNLRFPFRKQMSATLLRAVAAGCPVAVTDVPDWDHLPASFCYRIRPNEDEAANLAHWIAGLARDSGGAAASGRAAREHYLRHGTVRQMAEHYLAVIRELSPAPAASPSPSPTLTAAGRAPLPAPPATATTLADCKACEIEDFRDAELAALIRDIFPHDAAVRGPDFPAGAEDRKQWEIAMSVRALSRHGALRPDAALLGVGAGGELTSFYLTRHVAQVVATDLYLDPAAWAEASALMLTRPQQLCPFPFDSWKLTARHMDGRVLDFPDATFAGVFSAGSIEHFGDLADVAAGAYEIGRVLAPGGVASISTELLLAGPPGAAGWHRVHLFDAARLGRWIVEASGLELVGELSTAVSTATLATRRDLLDSAREIRHGERKLPHLVLAHDGQLFTSVHLTLRKTARYPARDNAWARPDAALRDAVAANAAHAGERLHGLLLQPASGPPPASATAPPAPVSAPAQPSAPANAAAPPPPTNPAAPPAPTHPAPAAAAAPPADPAAAPPGGPAEALAAAFHRWNAVWQASAIAPTGDGSAPRRAWGFLRRTLRRIRGLGVAAERESVLLGGLVAEATRTGADTAALAAAVADLQRETARLVDLNAERQDLLAAIHDVTTRQATLTARLGGFAVRQDALEEGLLAHSQGLLTVESRLGPPAFAATSAHPDPAASANPDPAASAHADPAASANAAPATSARPDPATSANADPAAPGLDAARLTALLAALEAALPALAASSSVAVSAHGPRAGELCQTAAAYFGGRHVAPDAAAPRFPNDAWLHLDLAPPGERPILLTNAAGRLGRRGVFVWVSAAPSATGDGGHGSDGGSGGSGGDENATGSNTGTATGAPPDSETHHPRLRPLPLPDVGDVAPAALRVRAWEKI